MKTYWSIFGLPFILTFVFAVDADARSQKRCSKKKAYHYWASVDAVCNKKGKTYEKKGRKSLDEEKKEEKEINDKATALQNSIMNDTAGVNGMVNASEKLTDLQMQANRNMAPRCKKAMDEFKKQCPGQFKGSLKKAQDNLDRYQEMADATKKYTNDDVTQTKTDTADPGMTDEESKAAKSDDPNDLPHVKAARERYEARKAAREAAANEMSPWEEKMAQEEAHRNALKERAELQRGANPDPEAVAERKEQEQLQKFLPEQNPKRAAEREAIKNMPLPGEDPNRAAKQAQREELAKSMAHQPVKADKNRNIDPLHFAERARQKVAESSLAYKDPPKYMKDLGVKKGTPEEWGEFFTKLTRQESALKTARVNGNKTLQRFATTPRGEKSFGPGQFNKGEYGLKTWSDVNNPDRVIDAYINVANRGNMYRYFGSIQRPHEVRQHNDWYNRVVRPNTSWSKRAISPTSSSSSQTSAPKSAFKKSSFLSGSTYDPIRDSEPVSKTAFNNEDTLAATEHAEMALANLDICGASQQIRDIATSDSEVSLNSAAGMSSQLDEMLIEKGYPPGSLGIEMYCQNQ